MTALAWLVLLIYVLLFLWLGWCVHTAKDVGPNHPDFDMRDRERLPR